MKNILSDIKIFVIMGIGLSLFTLIFFNIYIIAVLPVVLAVLIFFVTQTQRKLIKTTSTPIYRLTENVVKITGTITAEKSLQTPYSKETCVGYSYRKSEVFYDSDGDEQEQNITQENQIVDFYLTNETGKIKVNANELNLSFLTPLSQYKGNIKHIEKSLKIGETINILGNAVKNENLQFELQKVGKNNFVVSTNDIETKTKEGFKTIITLLPYIVLMYFSVNYFLFFAPVKVVMEQNTAFILFAIFGMPILAVILGVIGSKLNGFWNHFFSNFAGICFFISLLTFPLMCLLLMQKIEFYRIVCIWISIFICTTMALTINYNKLNKVFKSK